MALLDDVAHYLDDSTSALTLLGGTAGTGNLVKARMLDHAKIPDTVVGLYESPGWAPVWAFTTGSSAPAFERPGLQVIARSTSYTVARGHAYRCFRILDSVRNRVLPHTSSGTRYLAISAVGSPASLGQDQNGRFLLSVNFDVTKERSS
ncbi:MAG: hypothetical protein EHM91_06460 [Planctomycetota bacterium]|nr:MAG: hypothetical protein EHM91_06460 [Planctomycetota bacterium]